MSSFFPRSRSRYQLGAPIALADLLALPPDGNTYGRDEKGRLTLVAPDDAVSHRMPISQASDRLNRAIDSSAHNIVPDAPVALDEVFALDGSVLPTSHHGPKALVLDLACFADPVRFVKAPAGHTWFSAETLLVAIEFVSPSTWRNDLGEGSSGEEVDRWRTYLENGVSEYWILNAGTEACGLPPRSGFFLYLDRDRATWSDLPVDAPRFAARDARGRRPVEGGVVRSLAIPALTFDLGQFFAELPR